MRITVIGRGHVGGGLARRWTAPGHDVTAVGRDGGDATDADVVVVANSGRLHRGRVGHGRWPRWAGDNRCHQQVRRSPVGLRLGCATGQGDCRWAHGQGLQHQLRVDLGRAVDAEPVPPGTLFASDADARETTERLIRDAGFDPIHLGGLAQAPLLESLIAVISTLDRGDLGPFFYRFNRPGELSAR